MSKSEIFNLDTYITSSGKYPDRKESSELTEKVRANAQDLTFRLNALLNNLRIYDASFSSGFRTSIVNGKLNNAAKKSKHMTGEAGDIEKVDLAKLLVKFPEFLEEHDLYMEHPDCTPSWSHLQITSPRSGKRIFRCGICKRCK